MEGTIKLPDDFMKPIQLRIFDNQGGVNNGTFIIDNDQRNCKLIRGGGEIYYNIIKISNATKYNHIPFLYLREELLKVYKNAGILECEMRIASDKLTITDPANPKLKNIRIRFGAKTNGHAHYTTLTRRLIEEKNFKEEYTREVQALYERYKQREALLPLSPLGSRETFPVLHGLSARESVGNYIDPRISHPPIPIDPTEYHRYYHELPLYAEHGLLSDHSEDENRYSFMNEGSELRSPHESMLFN
jgi:hypothetical protein